MDRTAHQPLEKTRGLLEKSGLSSGGNWGLNAVSLSVIGDPR